MEKITNALQRTTIFKKLKGDTLGANEARKQPPLNDVALPKVKPEHQLALSDQGWTTITFLEPSDPLLESLKVLFAASKTFFALPAEYKSTFLTKEGSEEGWSCIEGEKEFITLRTLGSTPTELKDAAQAAWAEAGKLLNDALGVVAQSLGLPPESLTAYSKPCAELTSEKTATMIRLFRYEGHQAKVVAEPHADLGLLSFVIGDVPGLEVWNRYQRRFWEIERSYDKPAGSLLVGRQLEQLSNERYRAGGHRVRSYGTDVKPIDTTKDEPYRYSIVFVLRAHSPVLVDTDSLTTNITGQFSSPIKRVTAGELFQQTKAKHFNINTHVNEREQQKHDLEAKRDKLRS